VNKHLYLCHLLVLSFPYGFSFLCLCLHEEIKCNLYPGLLREHPGFTSAPKGQVRYYRYSLVVAGKEIGLVVNADKTKLMFMA